MLRTLASSRGWLLAAALVALAGMASSLGGCATGAQADSAPVGGSGGGPAAGTGGTGGGAGNGGTGMVVQSVEFTVDTPLSLPRGDVEPLEVQVWPPRVVVVRFALLPGPASTLPGDAALSATDLETNDDGRVTVDLTAPSGPTTFQVRASVEGGGSATREVNVEKTGKADLRVEPVYLGGRAVTRWFATAMPHQSQSCAKLPSDDLDWTESEGSFVELLDVAADAQLAVVVRAEHFAWGCATVAAAVEGMNNRVQVTVTNVPIQLAESEVTVSLDLDTFEAAFEAAFEPSILLSLDQAAAGGDDDVVALLDRMQAESGSDEAAFIGARATGAWDAAVRAALGASAATALRDPLERWLRAGLANTVAGRFIGTIGAAGDDPEGAALGLGTVAGLPPAALGISATNVATWYSSSPADDVIFGSTLELDPSTLLLGAALGPARTEVDGAQSVAEALAALLSCDSVATELVAHGAAAQVSYPGCSLGCARSLCENALATLVATLTEREEDETSSLEIAAATLASVGSEAELVGLDGTWVGSLVVDGEASSVGGSVLAPAP